MSDFAYKIIAIFISFLFLAHANYIKNKIGTFIFPSSLLSLAWFFFTIFPLTILFSVPVNPLGIGYILICVTVFSLGALPFNWANAYKLNLNKSESDSQFFESKFLKLLFFCSIIGSLVTTALVLKSSGISLSAFWHKFRESSGQFANLRFEGKLAYGIVGILNFFFTYITPVLGGLAFYRHKNYVIKIFAFAFTFFPVIVFMLTQSAKIIIFFSIGLYIAAYLVRKIYANSFSLFDKKIITKVIITVLIFIPLIILSISTRHNIHDVGQLSLTSMRAILGYALGQIYAFADYFAFYLGLDSTSKYIQDFNSYGRYTFTSIYTFLGGTKVFPPGTFYDYYNYNHFIVTNIYTIFRGLINDFGLLGTLLFMYLGGLLTHYFFYRLLIHRRSFLSIGIFIVAIVFIEGTYLYSIFMARYMYLLLCALVVIFWINHLIQKNYKA